MYFRYGLHKYKYCIYKKPAYSYADLHKKQKSYIYLLINVTLFFII